jgi:DNA-binding transcriptional LysR family regulator
MFTVARLRTFVAVAQHGSLSAAALELSYTQSAVSQQVAALEAQAGMPLLERHARGVRLTEAGETLLAHAESVLSHLDAAQQELAALAGLRAGRLRIASFPSAGATLMPLAVATFRARHPGVELTLAEDEPEHVLPRLAGGELDLALLFEFGEESEAGGQGFELAQLLEDPMYLALPSGHPLASRRRLRLEDLRGQSWVQTSSSSACARHVVRLCIAAGFEPQVSFESDDYQTIQGLVAAGVGVALIPEIALSSLRKDIAIRALHPNPPLRKVIAAMPPTAQRSVAAEAMLEILRDISRRYVPFGPAHRPSAASE